MLVRQGVLGASPQLCTLDIPKGVGREANTQGSRGTSSLESMILARTAEPAGREVADPSETAGNGQRRQAPLAGREVTSCCDTGQAATVPWLTGEQSVVFLQCKQSCRQRFLAGWSFLFRWGAGRGGRGGLEGAVRRRPLMAGGRGVSSLEDGCPRGAQGRVLPVHLRTQTSLSCPAGPLTARPPAQPGVTWGCHLSRRGTGRDRPGSGRSRCFPVSQLRRRPLPCAPGESHTERLLHPGQTGEAPRHTHSHGRKVPSPRVLRTEWAPGPAPRPGAQDQVSVGPAVDRLGGGSEQDP